MKRAVLVSFLFMACSLLFSPGAALADTRAVLTFPILGVKLADPINKIVLSDDIYLYSCADSSCSSVTQLKDYGHITNVPRWPKGNGGPGGLPPAIWVFLTLEGEGYQYYQFWQQEPTNKSCWQSCILGINAQGELDTSATTCTEIGTTPPRGTDGVASFTMGANFFSAATCGTPPANRSATNNVPSRSLTFLNGTSAKTVCLQTDSSFEHPECAGAQKITTQSPYVIANSDLTNGSNSGVGQVSGVMNDAGEWIYTGKEFTPNGQVYSTNLEWTVWPEHTQNTMGPTTIDISLVNGFNVGATLTPDKDCVCSVSDTEGGVPYFVLYKAGVPMADFPEPTTILSVLCPPGSEAPISQDNKYGCYSSCSRAKYYNSSDKDKLCCSGSYNTPATCTDPPSQPYVQNVNKYSTRVYSWAYNDWRGTFTCEPTASFTFTITDIDEIL